MFLWPLISAAIEAPTIPIGLDAYRQWQHWPVQRIGVRAYMRSTYDRTGGNEGADASHFLYQLADDQNVTLDVADSGILYFARYNHWHGSPWHYNVDGTDHIIQESSTADPLHPKQNSVFLPTSAFPNPLAWTWSDTRGADLSWVPIPFEKSFRMAYSRTHYGTGYYIYHQFVPGIKLSQPIKSWTPEGKARRSARAVGKDWDDVLELLNPRSARYRAIDAPEGKTHEDLNFDGSHPMRIEVKEPTAINILEFEVPQKDAIQFGKAKLRITWDDANQPSIEAPIALFFGAGTLYNRDNREYLVNAFPVCIRETNNSVHLACYFPMPFFKSAQIELVSTNKIKAALWVHTVAENDPKELLTYFHATYKDHGIPEPGKDLVLLNTTKVEGGGEWSGHFVGTSFIFSDRAVLTTLEGDPRFFFDHSRTPQAQGTGTEEWGGGGDYWGGQNMTLPFAGHPTGTKSAKEAKCDEDKIESAYRFLLADLMPFGKDAVIHLEHGGNNESTEHYQTVTYWYGIHHPTIFRTDSVQMGNAESEKSHNYNSPDASAPYEIKSRYERGIDHVNGRETYLGETDTGRTTKTFSEFTLKLDPKNCGVMLRRKLDYQYPNQRAEVFILRSAGLQPAVPQVSNLPEWQPAGTWYTAGANTCVYSNPKGELGAAEHKLQTSNRRFRDDEFLLPLDLTKGRSEIRVKVQFTPVKIPFYPGAPLPELAWSEIRYDAYCWVLPE